MPGSGASIRPCALSLRAPPASPTMRWTGPRPTPACPRGRAGDSPRAVPVVAVLPRGAAVGAAAAQTKPEGGMRWALYVTLSPVWCDPAEVSGQLTPFWFLCAIHDALVKPMPGNLMSPSLAESWTVRADQRVYEFKLSEDLKFHNGD